MSYQRKFLIVWIVIIIAFVFFVRISLLVKVPRWFSSPDWLLGLFGPLIAFGGTVVAAIVLAGLWQMLVKSK
jgi:hypothetical protein